MALALKKRRSILADKTGRIIARWYDYPWLFLFLLPFVLLYAGFTLWPLFATFYYSGFDWNGMGNPENFIGLKNYITIANDPTFWLSFRNTILFSIGNTAIKIPLALFMAILLTRRWLRFKKFFRTIFFMPMVIPVAMAGLIFTLLLNPLNGAVNDILKNTFGMAPVDFLGKPETALFSLILISVWQIFGQYMIYWMAALQNVPEEVYEAAELDGANELQKLFLVTLPIIRPVATLITFLALVNALRVFGLVVTLTSGGPGQSTYVISYFIYNQAFREVPFRYGYASAAAVLFGVLTLVAVTIQGYFVNRAQNSH